MIYIYMIISLALASSGGYYLMQWKVNRRRKDDLIMAGVFMLLTISYSVYAVENYLKKPKEIELVIDMVLGIPLS